MFRLTGSSPAAAKRARLTYREENEDLSLAGGEKRIVTKSDAGRLMLDALKPYPLEVVLTLTITNADEQLSKGEDCTCLLLVGVRGGAQGL